MTRRPSRTALLLLGLSVCVFCAAYAALADRAGLSAFDALPGAGAAAILSGRRFPLTWTYYHGAGDFYALAPFLAALGRTTFALQARALAGSLLGIGAAFLVGLELFGEPEAAACALLLACSPYFAAMTTSGIFNGTAEAGAATLALALSPRHPPTGRPGPALGAAAALAAGLACRTWLAAFVPGLAACLALSAPAGGRRRKPLGLYAACAGVVLLGALPVVLGDLRADGMRGWLDGLAAPETGRANWAYAANLVLRLRQLHRILEGTAELGWLAGRPFSSGGPGAALVAAAAAASGALLLRRARSQAAAWPAVVVCVYLALAPINPTVRRPDQLLPILPSVLLLGCALPALALGTARRKAAARALGLAAAAFAAGELFVLRGLCLRIDAGNSPAAAAARAEEELTDWLGRHPAARPVFLEDELPDAEWAVAYQAGRPLGLAAVSGADIVGGPPASRARWLARLEDPRAVFVLEALPASRRFPLAALAREAARRGLRPKLVGRAADALGRPVLELYFVEPAGALSRALARRRA